MSRPKGFRRFVPWLGCSIVIGATVRYRLQEVACEYMKYLTGIVRHFSEYTPRFGREESQRALCPQPLCRG